MDSSGRTVFQGKVEGGKCMGEESLVATSGFAKRSGMCHRKLLALNSAASKTEGFRCLC
jgi:hypothetical protein